MERYLEVRGLWKSFGPVLALHDVSFAVERNEFFTLLGPSGCGKTTLLRCVAGFEQADAGEVAVEGHDLRFDPPEKRDIGFVFQRYALFPTMTVYRNVAFGLEMRGLHGAELDRRVQEALDLVRLRGLEHRRPRELSGGQQQRVAVARALVIRPRLLLMDEPLSNLDAKLRQEMRTEIRRIQKETGITTLYVTHDQEEAFSLSDRILVMDAGRVQQIGTHAELYFQPANGFVADFIGQANRLPGEVVAAQVEETTVRVLGETLRLPRRPGLAPGQRVFVSVRPEHVRLAVCPGDSCLKGRVRQRQFLGPFLRYFVDIGGAEVVADISGITLDGLASLPQEGDNVTVGFSPHDCTLLEA
ncbi:MAG: ABC transporter ATP-binding protein [candidate division NC10 bacterium]|nr:ABC transporter ATP-binding protein [candidate division NC10 bacterium]